MKMALSLKQVFFLCASTVFSSVLTNGQFSKQSSLVLPKPMQKITHLHFYFHDIQSGKNATAIQIMRPPKQSAAGSFGTVYIIDDLLTEGPESGSKIVGRAQGIYAFASQHDLGLLMDMNFAFLEGIYNGSVLSVLGRNMVLGAVREMPVVGGTGIFRFARGHALARTVWFNQKGDAVVEYNVTVLHY